MRLCLALGYPSPTRLLTEMSSEDYSMWMAYGMIEPWGEAQANLRSALICQTIARVNTPKGKKPPKLEAFMPNYEKLFDKNYPHLAGDPRKNPNKGSLIARQVLQLHARLGGSGMPPAAVVRLAKG